MLKGTRNNDHPSTGKHPECLNHCFKYNFLLKRNHKELFGELADFSIGVQNVQNEPGTCFNIIDQENHQKLLQSCQKDSRISLDSLRIA